MSVNMEHPCFNPSVAGSIGRVHLPVATKCNMSCNYCNRNYSCPNENRPGVCASPLMTENIKEYIESSLKEYPEIKIAGIAGPAEPMADMELLIKTYKIISDYYPDLKLCLATNGIVLADNIDIIKDLRVNFVTITINALELETINKIYSSVYYENKYYYEIQAARIIQDKQLEALEALKNNKIKYKVNTIFIPGINDFEVINISRMSVTKNALIHNIIPIIPLQGTKFENISPPSKDELEYLRNQASKYLSVSRHCRLCRSDAKGLIGI